LGLRNPAAAPRFSLASPSALSGRLPSSLGYAIPFSERSQVLSGREKVRRENRAIDGVARSLLTSLNAASRERFPYGVFV